MDLKEFMDAHGHSAVHALAKKVGSDYVYLRQIAYGHRKPSPKFAKELVEAARGELRGDDGDVILAPVKRDRLRLVSLRPDVYG